jgi:hypothetical protein
MVAVVSAVTAEAVAVNVAVDVPTATPTEGGMLSEALLLDRVTKLPPPGAGMVNVRLQAAALGPIIEDGLQVRLLTCAMAATVRLTVVVAAVPFAVAVTVTGVVPETVPAVVEKVAVVAPAGTATEAGKVKAGLLLDKLMDKPVTSAGLLNVTAQVEVSPAWNVDGLQFNHVGTAGASSVSEELTETPFSVAAIVAVVSTVTPEALAAKTAVDAPAATIIEAGVLREVRLADRVTADPPAGAGMVKVIVQAADPVPVMEDGLQSKPLT